LEPLNVGLLRRLANSQRICSGAFHRSAGKVLLLSGEFSFTRSPWLWRANQKQTPRPTLQTRYCLPFDFWRGFFPVSSANRSLMASWGYGDRLDLLPKALDMRHLTVLAVHQFVAVEVDVELFFPALGILGMRELIGQRPLGHQMIVAVDHKHQVNSGGE